MPETTKDPKIVNADERLKRLQENLCGGRWTNKVKALRLEFIPVGDGTRGQWEISTE